MIDYLIDLQALSLGAVPNCAQFAFVHGSRLASEAGGASSLTQATWLCACRVKC
jgi:hypothetical protein